MSPDEYINRCLEGNYNSPSAAIPSTENRNRQDFQRWLEDNPQANNNPQAYETWKKENFTEDRPFQEYKDDMLDYRRDNKLGRYWDKKEKDWIDSDQNKIESFKQLTPILGINVKRFMFSYTYSSQMGDIVLDGGGHHQITLGFNVLCQGPRASGCPNINSTY